MLGGLEQDIAFVQEQARSALVDTDQAQGQSNKRAPEDAALQMLADSLMSKVNLHLITSRILVAQARSH